MKNDDDEGISKQVEEDFAVDDEEEEIGIEDIIKQGLKDDEFDDFLVDKTIWDNLKAQSLNKTELAAEYLSRRYVTIGLELYCIFSSRQLLNPKFVL